MKRANSLAYHNGQLYKKLKQAISDSQWKVTFVPIKKPQKNNQTTHVVFHNEKPIGVPSQAFFITELSWFILCLKFSEWNFQSLAH